MKSSRLRVKYIISIKPQLRIQIVMFRPIRVDHTNCLQVAIKTHSFKRIYLNFWQIYLILCFEVNKHKFSRKLGIFCVKCIFWKVNIIDIFNSKKP
jgi:hypothetical protein